MRELLSTARRRRMRRSAGSMARWAGCGLVILAFAMRIFMLSRQELSFDEVASFFIANRTPLDLATYVRAAVREHPPIYYLMLSLWMPLAGTSEFAIRFLSVLIGTVTVAATHRVLKRILDQPTAVLGTLLLVTSPFHVRISRDARMYALLALWALLSISAFVSVLEQGRGDSSPRWFPALLTGRLNPVLSARMETTARWALFWLATSLGIFTHYFMVFLLLAQDLYLLLRWRRHRHLLPAWLACHGTLGIFLLLVAYLSPGLSATLVSLWQRGTASTVRWQALARGLNGLYLGVTSRPDWRRLGVCLAATTLGLLPLRQQNSKRIAGTDGLLWASLLSVPILAVLVLPEQISGRYLTPAFPASIVAMAMGLSGLFDLVKNRLPAKAEVRLQTVIACVLPLAMLSSVLLASAQAYRTVYFPPGESYRDKIDYLNAYAQPDDGLLLHGPWQHLLLHYYDVEALNTYTVPLSDLRVDGARIDETLSQVFDTHERVWVSYDSVEPVDPNWEVSRWLHRHTHQVLAQGSLTLHYRSPAVGTPSLETGDGYEYDTQLSTQLGDRLLLTRTALSNVELTSGEAVLLLSQWRVLDAIFDGLRLRLELVGPGDQVWETYEFMTGPTGVSDESGGEDDTFIERRGLTVPVGTPPGDYRLRLRVISPGGQEWLPKGDEPLEVGSIRVQHHTPRSQVVQTLPGQDLHAVFGGTISLVGYAPWGHSFSQGNPVLFDVYWQALRRPTDDYELEVEVLQQDGTSVLTSKRLQHLAGRLPTSSWEAGELLKAHVAVQLPADAPPGPFQVRLSLIDVDGSPVPVKGTRIRRILSRWEHEVSVSGPQLVLFRGRIEPRPRMYDPPAMDHHLDVVLSTNDGQPRVSLLGYNLAPMSTQPGGSFEVTYYWKALSRMDNIYAVFNHVVAPDGTQLTQEDGWPQHGSYHTSQWLPGEVVEDRHTVQVPAGALPGDYVLRVGMYDAATLERLDVAVDGASIAEQYIVLSTIVVTR